MRTVVQRVSEADIKVNSDAVASIGNGILALVGIHKDDEAKDMEYIADKLLNLRIFGDSNEAMNLSIQDIDGDILIVSQFTLYGDARKGRRPSFSGAMAPDKAVQYYDDFLKLCSGKYPKIKSGIFGAMMEVNLVNNGPVTILLDSRRNF
ncbi:MAG: D-tyrosyl-tRNA(Tyr) deacylase [Spirochaetes bacterium]|nr:D-tyrosyl-tRNA(Tyr) deacylase [Spirochaetota bacterium]